MATAQIVDTGLPSAERPVSQPTFNLLLYFNYVYILSGLVLIRATLHVIIICHLYDNIHKAGNVGGGLTSRIEKAAEVLQTKNWDAKRQ